MGAATSAHQKAKIDGIWASMNASDAVLPSGGSRSEVAAGRKGAKGKAKKKVNKKANKVRSKPGFI